MYISSGCQARHSRDSYWQNITATHSLQQTATHCNALQRIATHKCKCGTGCRYYAWHSRDSYWQISLQHAHCNTLQHTQMYIRLQILRVAFPWLVLKPTPIRFLMRLANWCVMTPSYVCHDWLICVSWLILMFDMAHLHVWRDSYWYPRYPCLDATGALVCHDSLICVSWLPHMCVMSPWYACHDSFTCILCHDSFKSIPWLIHMCIMLQCVALLHLD